MQEIIIHNWDELQRAVFDDVWDEKIMRYRDNRIYRGMADELIARSDELAPEEGRKAVELLKRCEILFGMSQTFSEASEKFRLANVMGGKNYAATATAKWRVLERELGLEPSVPERGRISVQHLQNHSFN